MPKFIKKEQKIKVVYLWEKKFQNI